MEPPNIEFPELDFIIEYLGALYSFLLVKYCAKFVSTIKEAEVPKVSFNFIYLKLYCA